MDDYYSDNQPELIHCPNCGEDYAATYRSCPFCNAANTRRSGSGKSGSSNGRSNSSRVRTNTRGGGYGGQRSPLSIIGIVVAVVLVVATVIVVFSLIRSALTGGKDKTSDNQDSSVTTPLEENEDSEEGGSESSEMVISPDGLSLSQTTLTLSPEEDSFTLTATPDPEGWVGQIIWSSNDGGVATVNQAGVVSYVGDGTCTITASASGVIATCEVTCSSGSTGSEGETGESTEDSTAGSGTATTLVIKAYGSTMGSDVTIRVGESVPFVAEGGDGSSYTWSIQDSSIASVDSATGTCVGLSSGVTYLTVTSGGESLSLKVIVR